METRDSASVPADPLDIASFEWEKPESKVGDVVSELEGDFVRLMLSLDFPFPSPTHHCSVSPVH